MEGSQVYSDKQVVISRDAFGRLVIAGAVDYFNAGPVAAVLVREMERSVPDGVPVALDGAASTYGDLQVDLSRLEFSDVSGIRAMVGVAEHAVGGRRLVLRGLPPQISRVMAVVGWSELPNLVVEGP
ncbi:MAG TPA: STAS domain-containing protein [Candidatus Baltobacterales bacterium]|nr:STAS domain-containing protein [Candidatus Baltobacterales bacterium]